VPGGRARIMRSRVLITRSDTWLTNDFLDRLSNRRIIVNGLAWLTQDHQPIATTAQVSPDRSLQLPAERQSRILLPTASVVPAVVSPDARKTIEPLLASRAFTRPAPLREYGLDHPQATLTYTNGAGTAADVDIGQPNFDRHFVYAQRRGRPAVYLLAADTLRPVLALVGVDIKPPD